jgi:hypothetical protein
MINEYIYIVLLHNRRYMTIKEIVNGINAMLRGENITYHQVYRNLEKHPFLYDKIIFNSHCHKYNLI